MDIVTERFIEYLFEKYSMIPDKILKKAIDCERDYQAVVMAGANKNKDRWESFLEVSGSGMSIVWGFSQKTDARTAAFINAFNAHSLELDDGQRFAMIHLGACIISALYAVKDCLHFSEEDFRRGIVMGYEAACRLSIAMQPSHKQRGYHASGTCGTIGAAVAIAFATKMTKAQMKCVITSAVGSAAGMLEMQAQKSELKPFNVGRAAMDGVNAAYMGLTGFASPDDILGGERGFFKTFSDACSVNKLIEQTGYYEIERIYVKPYASCRHSHSAVEAAIKLHDQIEIGEISSVVVETYKLAVKGHDHTEIEGIASAKLSTPYAVAAALIHAKADWTVFEPLDQQSVQLAAKVKVVECPELTAQSPQKRIAIVKVITEDGTEWTSRVDYAKGDPENPMTERDLEEKHFSLLAYAKR